MKHEFAGTKKSGESPLCAVPEEIQSAIVGMPFCVNIVASDPDGLITGITADPPRWATLDTITELPSPDVIARISGIPGTEDKGLLNLIVVVTDSEGRQATGTLKIKVDHDGFLADQPGVS